MTTKKAAKKPNVPLRYLAWSAQKKVWLAAVEMVVRSWCAGQNAKVKEITGRSSVTISVMLKRTRDVAISRMDFACPWGCGFVSRDQLAHELARRIKKLMVPGAVVGLDALKKKQQGDPRQLTLVVAN